MGISSGLEPGTITHLIPARLRLRCLRLARFEIFVLTILFRVCMGYFMGISSGLAAGTVAHLQRLTVSVYAQPGIVFCLVGSLLPKCQVGFVVALQ